MRIALFFSLLLSTAAFCQDRPNIIFIIADDLGWADVEFHGGNTPTPNLNRLLAEGVELTQHYVAPVCSPTRAGFLTGRYWSRFGITTPINNQGLPFETVTLSKALGDAGYSTALIGKWHLGSKPEWGPNHFGFHDSYGSLAGGIAPYNHKYKKGEFSTTWHRNHELIDEQGHVTDLLTDEAVKWIGEKTSTKNTNPFFLYLPYTAVHLPIREPDEWLAKVPKEIEGEVPRQYSACILHLDAAVGRVVDAIDKAGKKTIRLSFSRATMEVQPRRITTQNTRTIIVRMAIYPATTNRCADGRACSMKGVFAFPPSQGGRQNSRQEENSIPLSA